MRYQHWDVLLFPEQSRTPIQEFDVKCYVLPTTEDTLHLVSSHGSTQLDQLNLARVPTLTGFVVSQEPGRTFRVSIHCWERPSPSEYVTSIMTAHDAVVFEAKVYIDGQLDSRRVVKENATWPKVIENAGDVGEPPTKPLRFPAFHSEILQQSYWNANDGVGRIRVVISEGLIRNGDVQSFVRLKEVIAFSFQHAPRHILEYSQIAWPNPSILQQLNNSGPHQNDLDAHTHSPKKIGQNLSGYSAKPHQTKNEPTMLVKSIMASKWAPKQKVAENIMEDPFIEPRLAHSRSQTTRRSCTDVSMADYASGLQGSEMSGVTTHKSSFEHQLGQANIEEILQALTSQKRNALLTALLPPEHHPHVLGATTKTTTTTTTAHRATVHNEKKMGHKASKSDLSARVLSRTVRRASTDSRRSTSDNSAAMSWDEIPTLGNLWSGSEDLGRPRSTSAASKRKRSISPASEQLTDEDSFITVKGMSTSPCKRVASAKKQPLPVRTIE